MRRLQFRENFRSVIQNGDDQVIVRTLLMELVPPEIKAEIVRRFNDYVQERNDRIDRIEAESR